MPARTDQIDKIKLAAQYLEASQNEHLDDGFDQRGHTVHLQPEGDNDPTHAAVVTFTWDDDHYNFTVA